MAVYFENQVIHISTFCEKMQSFDVLKLVFHIITTIFKGLKDS